MGGRRPQAWRAGSASLAGVVLVVAIAWSVPARAQFFDPTRDSGPIVGESADSAALEPSEDVRRGDEDELPTVETLDVAELPGPTRYEDEQNRAARLARHQIALRAVWPDTALVRRIHNGILGTASYVAGRDGRPWLVTAEFLVRGAATLVLTLPDGTEHTTRVVATDRRLGLVALEIPEEVDAILTTVAPDPRAPQGTVWKVARGVERKPFVGIAKAGGRGEEALAFYRRVDQSPAVGGPLYTDRGRLWGIVGLIDEDGVGWAIPAGAVVKFVDALDSGTENEEEPSGVIPIELTTGVDVFRPR